MQVKITPYIATKKHLQEYGFNGQKYFNEQGFVFQEGNYPKHSLNCAENVCAKKKDWLNMEWNCQI